ncbi:MAG: hypothetical protein JWQ55_257 [Rhodopila sp.]|nr:hypothetical protein [Rhodopila sp.]
MSRIVSDAVNDEKSVPQTVIRILPTRQIGQKRGFGNPVGLAGGPPADVAIDRPRSEPLGWNVSSLNDHRGWVPAEEAPSAFA